jgi:Zn-dependent M28 family amino/carboxypeptidase
MKNLLLFLAMASLAAPQGDPISGEHIRADVKFLSSDLLEGRAVGARGGQLATEYIATQFALAGLQPAGDNGSYFQKVPLVGITTRPTVKLSATGKGQTVDFKYMQEFVGVDQRQKAVEQFDAEAIFVGHGIVAPEFQWDDFKGVDVRGKMLVLFTNEPDSNDPKFFGGRALTYYGRWSYKYEEALRKGALGVIIIHTTPTAGYGWDVVRSSWSGEQPVVKLAPGAPELALTGWLTKEAGEKLLAMAGKHVDELLKASNSRDFRPIPLGIRIRGTIPSKIRALDTRNVAGLVPGSDPSLKSEVVIFSAHWDHLGIGEAVNGDTIYNGAVDNGTGCGILLEIARAWAALPQKPKRSALFLSVTAEEGGLRGSEYYAAHPIIPAAKTVVDVNYDALLPLGRTTDIVVAGAERTTLWPIVQHDAQRLHFEIAPEAHPEQGHYYRSDHFSFARAGIPAFSIALGSHFAGKPAGFSEEAFKEFNTRHYHQPSDEYHADWDFSGLQEAARLGFLIGIDAANLDKMTTWNAGDEFLAAREKSGVK